MALPSLPSPRAAFGDGVYLTMLEPQYGEGKIMKNNWDGAAVSRDKVELMSS